jgi:hypothetical protein
LRLIVFLLNSLKGSEKPANQLNPNFPGSDTGSLAICPKGRPLPAVLQWIFSKMASTPHDGIIDDDRVYTTKALALLMGYKQARSAEEQCEKIGCKVKRLGAKSFVSGYEFRLAIEAWDGKEVC